MKIKVLLFRDAVSLVHSKLKLLSYVLDSPNVLNTLNISRKAIPQRGTAIRETFTKQKTGTALIVYNNAELFTEQIGWSVMVFALVKLLKS